MKKKHIVFFLLFTLLSNITSYSQIVDSTGSTKEKTKKGWTFGALPALAFDSDIGFKYGAVLNLFYFGDGSTYPVYRHSLFFEWSLTTKGSGINQFLYDSKYLIPGIRVSVEASYLTERAIDYYGYNGYEAIYDSRLADDSPSNPYYISRQYYRQERKLFRLRADFQGKFLTNNLRWLAGITNYNIQIDTIDVDRMNRGKSDDDKLPYVGGELYGQYAYNWGIIPQDEIKGGNSTLIRTGLIFDSRDNEPNPMKGLWSDVIFLWSPSFTNTQNKGFSKIAITHRQYFTLVPKRLSFVYRIGYQAKLSGVIPSYMLPFIFNGGNSLDRDGLGGAKTLRGILRNRIVGEDYLYGNLEFRWKFIKTVVFNQNVYSALNVFSDYGMVTRKYAIDKSKIPAQSSSDPVKTESEKMHVTYGIGLHGALNENFVMSFNYGIAVDKRDGKSGIYIGLNWLF
jgi:hypothetical protein